MESNYETWGSIYGEVSRFFKDTSTNFQTVIKDEGNRAYFDAVNQQDWSALRRVETGNLTFSSSSAFFYCPSYVLSVLAVIDASSAYFLEATRLEYMAWDSVSSFANAGKAINWADAGDSAYLADFTTTPETLNIVSSSSADTSQSVRITGVDTNNVPISETITLNGLTVVPTTNTYKDLQSVSCDSSHTGIITYSGVTSTTVYGRIGPAEKTVRYKRLRIFQPPFTSNGVALMYKKAPNRLINDQDIPEIPVSGYLRERMMAISFQYDENWAAAQQHIQLAEQALQKAIENDSSGADEAIQTRPWLRPKMNHSRYWIGRPGG